MQTIVVCDTEPVAIEGLRSLLESAGNLRVVAAESTLEDGMEAVRELRPSILVVDKHFGHQALADCLNVLANSPHAVLTIVWGHSFSEPECVRLVQAGVAGILRKTASLDTVLQCLNAIQQGRSWVCGPASRDARRSSPLTAREVQVMELVEMGLKNKDIGAMLGISTGTVKIHLKHIFEKTGIHGRYSLIWSRNDDRLPASVKSSRLPACSPIS